MKSSVVEIMLLKDDSKYLIHLSPSIHDLFSCFPLCHLEFVSKDEWERWNKVRGIGQAIVQSSVSQAQNVRH